MTTIIEQIPDTIRRVEGGRLVYYRTTADQEFWNDHWRTAVSPETWLAADKGCLGLFESLFLRYLPRAGRILEAGCGPGLVVAALRARGFDCEGIEWGEETVRRTQAQSPGIPVRHGDVLNLDVPDHHYHAYVSLGVIEHRWEGPEPFLAEAKRVLAQNGVMLVSVPWFHPLRRLKARLGMYREPVEQRSFYQYAFTDAEMTNILEQSGFTVMDRFCYDSFKGIKDEVAPFRWLARIPALRTRLQWRLAAWTLAEQSLGHMILFVCRPAAASK